MDNNKILTVSYGTFSCTLEGFEDSFGTMKAIAEYFRDLASEDRYFGAEPPQPDAGLLARIAEREASQRVEAHEHDGQIMLKAHEDDTKDETSDDASEETKEELIVTEIQKTTAASELLVDPETTEAEVKPAQTHDTVDLTPEAPVEEDVLDHVPNIELPTSEKNISVSEDEDHASGIEADFVEPGHEEAQDVTPVETLSDEVEEETREAQTSAPDAPLEQQNTPEETSDVPIEELHVCDKARDTNQEQTPDPMANVATFFAKSVVGNQADMDTEEESCVEVLSSPVPYPRVVREPVEDGENSVPAAPANRDISDSLAEKLQRIRAVVSKNDGPDAEIAGRDAHMGTAPELDAETVNEAVEEAKAEETESSPGAEAEQSSIQAFNLSAFATASTTEAAKEEDVDELDLLLRRIENGEALDMFDAEAEPSEDAPEQESSGGMFYHQGEGEEKDPIVGSQTVTIEDAEEFTPDDEPADAEETVRNAQSRTPSSNEIESSDEVDASAMFSGRVLKIERAKLEEALEAGELEELESNQNPLQAKDVEPSQPLSAMDNSDLSEKTLADFSSVSKPAHAKLPEIDLETGEDVSRLMAQTEQQMKEPDGENRRSAFSHLRAAVAARFADKSIDENTQTEEQAAEAYKSDLAEAVTPQRKHDAAQTDGQADTVVAPLQLVAEQRVDLQGFAPRGPVAPRRVAASDIDDLRPSEDNGFGYYAEQRGASSLSELLEAAAAYLSFVEGYEQFTRPQLMSRARMAGSDDFSREEGLRSFGQLLRTGKIKKIKGGRFAASDSIGFKPDHRAAG